MKKLAFILCLCVSFSFFSISIASTKREALDPARRITGKTKGIVNAKQDKLLVSNKGSLIKTSDFLYYFNYYAALSNQGHALSLANSEISRFSNSVLLKTVFNGCEILSLDLSADCEEVTEIHCTWANMAPGALNYSDDFICLLMEALFACGLKTDSVADVFSEIGSRNKFDIGDSGEAIADGIKVSYSVSKGIGVSFIIEKV